ncbi:MAG: 2OG-Fe(II) oxygenase [Pseudomonadota bacterium]|uniref:2OG-Fe(II) oxygenase n=1 Tax=Rhizorhabdus phycosphaerae TaxID=2711156 RepID=UPI0013EAE160|nr:2OG-Fe(II) oxygenase [Rhizorhabdus phycosphaerae]
MVDWVDADGFAEAEPEQRFFQHQAYERALPGRELSPGILDLVRFKALLSSAAFLDLALLITGHRPTALQELLIRRMVRGDLARRHDDAIGGRTICALLYFSDGWHQAMGGEFVMHGREGDIVIDPLPNRMIIFDVNTGLDHSVRPLSEVAGDWQRFNFSIWFR